MSRESVIEEINRERAYHDAKWGGAAHDDRETTANWQYYLREYSQGEGRGKGRDFRTRMVKTAALAIAAIEAYDRADGS
jgi:hypothetical protein